MGQTFGPSVFLSDRKLQQVQTNCWVPWTRRSFNKDTECEDLSGNTDRLGIRFTVSNLSQILMILWYFVALLLAVSLSTYVTLAYNGIQILAHGLHECLKNLKCGHRDSWICWIVGWTHSGFPLPGNLKKGDRFKLAPKIGHGLNLNFQRFVSPYWPAGWWFKSCPDLNALTAQPHSLPWKVRG